MKYRFIGVWEGQPEHTMREYDTLEDMGLHKDELNCEWDDNFQGLVDSIACGVADERAAVEGWCVRIDDDGNEIED